MPYDPDVFLVQAGLKSLGFDPGPLDGVNGPATKAARSAWADSHLQAKAESAETPDLKAFLDRLIRTAEGELSIRETSKNQGPGIEKYWTATSYPDGYQNREPYCAAGLCWAIREAAKGLAHKWQLPTSPAAFGFDEWARANASAGISYRVTPAKARRGDIVVFSFSHVGLVVGRDADGDLLTIEWNTNAAGSREGDGCFRKSRGLANVRSIHRFNA